MIVMAFKSAATIGACLCVTGIIRRCGTTALHGNSQGQKKWREKYGLIGRMRLMPLRQSKTLTHKEQGHGQDGKRLFDPQAGHLLVVRIDRVVQSRHTRSWRCYPHQVAKGAYSAVFGS